PGAIAVKAGVEGAGVLDAGDQRRHIALTPSDAAVGEEKDVERCTARRLRPRLWNGLLQLWHGLLTMPPGEFVKRRRQIGRSFQNDAVKPVKRLLAARLGV